MKSYYEFAGIRFSVELPASTKMEYGGILTAFEAEPAEDVHRFVYSMVERLSPPQGICLQAEPALRVYRAWDETLRYIGAVSESWENAYLRAEDRGKQHHVQLKASAFPSGFSGKTILNSLGVTHLVSQNGGFVFHSSYIAVDGKAILFTAPSGTGKSTQAALWERYRFAEVINGDRSAVRWSKGRALACGIPFAGSSNICKNVTLPLGAIVYLKQSPQNQIRRLRGAESFRRVWEGSSVNTWDKADVAAVSETVQQVVCTVPVLELACTPDEQAVKALEETLRQEGIL
jgi:hypothetical protein